MIIRTAELHRDALAMVDIAKECMEKMSFRSLLPRTTEDLIEVVGHVVTIPGVEIIVAEHNGNLVGVLGILYAAYPWNPDILMANEFIWWTRPDAPYRTAHLLIDEAMNRIRQRNAVPVFRSLRTNRDNVHKLYGKYGMEAIETVFMPRMN